MNDLKDNENFCIAPWMHLHVINDGRAFACCQTPLRNENSFGNVKDQSLLEVMNSSKAKEMRKNMLEGNPLPPACERCVTKQSNNLNTMRTGLNNKWFDKTKDLIATTAPDGTIPELQLKYWDFRFSNYCNLACTTCSPLFSTQWSKDWKQLHPNSNHYDTRLIDLKEANVFWDDIEHNLDAMSEIHFAGGEPLMMPEHWRILDLLDQKKKYNVELRYSTNGTTLGKNKDAISYWKKFKYVHLSLSIDGQGDAFEHIRYKGVWKDAVENMKKIRYSGAVDYWIHPTVSILNIFRLTELHSELHNLDLLPLTKMHKERGFNIDNYWVDRFHINPLFTPDYYSITALPLNLKERAADNLRVYGKKMESQFGIPYHGWENIISFMYQENNSHLWDRFIQKSTQLDKVRNTDIFKLNPELLDAKV